MCTFPSLKCRFVLFFYFLKDKPFKVKELTFFNFQLVLEEIVEGCRIKTSL